MTNIPPRRSLPPGTSLFTGVSMRVKLIARLVTDSRVHPLLKALPFASLVYVIAPDLLIGPVDDAALLWVGTYLFVELCPPDVVEEHWQRLMEKRSPYSPADPNQPGDEDVIDGEYRDLDQ